MKRVCTGDTGHAEVIQLEFDPAQVSFDTLLHVFWAAHDPTTLNRQGADSGTQYRSIILYESEAQKHAAEKSKAEAQKDFSDPIVTQIVPLKAFYKAEKHHQDYFNTHRRPESVLHGRHPPEVAEAALQGADPRRTVHQVTAFPRSPRNHAGANPARELAKTCSTMSAARLSPSAC